MGEQRFKDQFWVKRLKWLLYKRYTKRAQWHTQYFFDVALRALKPGDVALDCGANVGSFTERMAMQGAEVHAFEPDPYSFGRLTERVGKYPNVTCHNAAVGTQAGSITLYRRPDFERNPEKYSLSSSVFADKSNVGEETGFEVEQIDLIAFAEKLEKPVAITKIDVEGAEVPILEEMLRRDRVALFGKIFVETHENRIPSLAERTQKLRDALAQNRAGQAYLDWG